MFGPHETNLGYRREMSTRHVAYYARRAAGGAGMVGTEVASVHDSDHPYERAPLAADCGAGWADVARARRPHGALVLAGLGHAGAQGSTAYGPTVLWGPSRVADVVTREVPMEMEQPEVDALVAGFGDAAALAVRAGLDGVGVNAGQHSILRQFCSGLTNHRTDAYGHDRDRLLREVLVAVRAALGEDRILGLRLCGDELAPWAGITPAQAAVTAAAIAGWIDHLVVVRGSGLSVHATRPDLHTSPGFNRLLCAHLRIGPGVAPALPGSGALVLPGSVVDPGFAQAALDEGVADLVEMTRAQIAEPDLVAHVRAGTSERVRTCTLSNQRTAVRDTRNPLVSDDAEPGAGHELEDPPVDGTDPYPRDVLVVGGGPTGLEAGAGPARAGGTAGRTVRRPRRALRLAAAVGGRARMGLLIRWWERELARLDVDVRLGTEFHPAEFHPAEFHPAGLDGHLVLLATGSRPGPRTYPSDGVVLDAASFEASVLAAGSTAAALDALPPGPVVVHDPIGDWTGVGVASQIAAAGRPTAIVTPDQVAGMRLGDPASAHAWLARAAVTPELRSTLLQVRAGRVLLERVWTGERREIGCAFVVDCGHRLPEDALWLARRASPRAGDCVAPRTVYEAVLEGRRAAAFLVRENFGRATPEHRCADAALAPEAGPADPAQPDRVLRPPHRRGCGRPPHRPAHRLLCRAGRGRGRTGDHRGALGAPGRPALREADPGARPRRCARVPAPHRRRARPRCPGARAAQPQRWAVVRDVLAGARVGPVAGAGPDVPGGPEGRHRRRHPRDHRRLRAGGRALRGRRVRRRRAPVLARVAAAPVPLAAGEPARRRLRRSLENRVRIVREVVVAVRAAIGSGRAVGARLCGDEGIPGGTPLAEAVETARILERDGVDYVNTSVGVATATLHLVEAPMPVGPGYALCVPSAIRAAVSVPVIGVGRFTVHGDAERALVAGHCDLVGVVRGQIADPDLAAAPTRTCVGCNQECVGRVGLNQRLRCVVNPRAGRDAVRLPAPTVPGQRVLVVGGGPAGLAAAAAAAARGHRVTLCERAPRTGGQVRVAASAPGSAEFGNVTRDLLAECRRRGVEIRIGVEVAPATVDVIGPDVVVLATGSRPTRQAWAPVPRLAHTQTPTRGGSAYDWVVCAVPPTPEDGLWHALAGTGVAVHRIGDCLAPRRAHAAISEGERVAVAL